MTNLTKLALVAVVALTASTSIASAMQIKVPQPNKPHTHSNMTIECRVRDDNFWIINFGDKNLDSGLQIAWRSPATDDSGVVLLPKMLAPGDEVKLAGVLTDFANGGDPCSAALV
ncbi:MAG: hypothetical protein ABI216_01400 [Devosia sp.]